MSIKRSHLALAGAFSLLATSLAHAQPGDFSIPHEFSPATPAKAEHVNANFDALLSQQKALDTRLINSPAENPQMVIDVDCDADSDALSRAWHDHATYRNVVFQVIGSCYGDIFITRDAEGDVLPNSDGAYTFQQLKGQVVEIRGPGPNSRASIIPRPETGRISLLGGFGGGLYLHNLALKLGSNDSVGVLFSRNSQGGLTNVSIDGQQAENSTGITVQEGAQTYLQHVNISNADVGLHGFNSAVIRVHAPVQVTNAGEGIVLQGSSLFQTAGINVEANSTGVRLFNSMWRGWDNELNVTQGFTLDEGSVLRVVTVNTDQISMFSSEIMIETLSADTVVARRNSSMHLRAGRLNSLWLSLNSSAHAESGFNFGTVDLASGSSLTGNFTTDYAYALQSTISSMQGASFNRQLELVDSTINAQGTTISGQLTLDQSTARFFASSSINPSSVRCQGLSIVNYNGVDFIEQYPHTRCLRSMDANKLFDVIRQQRGL